MRLRNLGGCSQMSSDIITAVLNTIHHITNDDDGDNTILHRTMVEFTASGAIVMSFY